MAVPCRCAVPGAQCARLIWYWPATLTWKSEPKLSEQVLPAGSYIVATEPLSAALAPQLIPQNWPCATSGHGLLSVIRRPASAVRRCLSLFGARSPRHLGLYASTDARVFPQLANVRIDYQWGGMIGITANRFPQVGRLSGIPMCSTPRLFRTWPERDPLVRQVAG